MKGSELRLSEYMKGAKKRFIIPVYQRNYDWKIENCEQLYDDLVKIIKNNRKTHFFGSIVSVRNQISLNEEYLVIDGQQRLTTVSLLFLAMYNLLSKGLIKSEDETMASQIYEDFLVDKDKPNEKRIKLKPIKEDQEAFVKLFYSEKDYVKESNLTANYNFFYNRIQREEISIDELFDAIGALEIINIVLTEDDNPQLVFESLNSTGLALSEGDKIRNYVLMGLPTSMQEEYYERYWNKIEKYTAYDVSSYVRDFLSIKKQAIPPQNKVYSKFKEFTEGNNIETKDLLEELLDYSRRYKTLLFGETKNSKLNACIYRLNRIGTTVTRPFFLEVLRLYDEEVLTLDEVTDIFLTTESYLFRRIICDLPTNALNKIFLMLHREIVRYDGTVDDYVNKFKYALTNKKERARFPNDEEFSISFAKRQVYMMNGKNKIYILERLENYGTNEDKDVYRHCDEGVYSIEHIMPQHLTPRWIDQLGEDYKLIHETWLHRIANLTLTAYNSKYSNLSFREKKTMKNGFEDSGIRMNTYIAKNDNWTLKEIEARSEFLSSRALEIWPYPKTSYKPIEKQLDTYTLEDADILPGRMIAKFSFKNTEQPVSSWIEMYQKVLKILYDEDKTILIKLASSNEYGLAMHFNFDDNGFIESMEIGDDVYVWTHTNTQSKLTNLNKLFNLYDIAPSELVFYLRDEIERKKVDDYNKEEVRLRYWEYALNVIHEHLEDKIFVNVNPTKDNCINGFFGVSGFSICCVANRDGARVEINFGKSSKEENKKAFDNLYKYRFEIEEKLGTRLHWNRNDNNKKSKVYCSLSDVSIVNEQDWKQMANFHAKWSNRFYDVIVPYLK